MEGAIQDTEASEREAAEERRTRFGLLLLALIAVFAIEGIATPGRWEQVILAVLLGVTLALSGMVADARPAVERVMVGLAVAVVVLSFIEALNHDANGTAIRIANLLLVALAPPAVVVGTVRNLRARGQVTIEAVFGVLSVYLLVGMFFAALYHTIARIHGPFFAQNVPDTIANCIYFSFTTLTTVGYGDLTAARNLGHTLSVSEALLGQIYLVTVVSLIVSNLRPRRAASAPRSIGGGD